MVVDRRVVVSVCMYAIMRAREHVRVSTHARARVRVRLWSWQLHPRSRAGFIPQPVTGPKVTIIAATVAPITTGAAATGTWLRVWRDGCLVDERGQGQKVAPKHLACKQLIEHLFGF